MIDTLANVKTALKVTGTTDDALLTRLQDAADSFVAAHTGRDFAGGTFTEAHAGNTILLFLRNYPVSAVGSVRVDAARVFGTDTILTATSYVLHAERGVIESVGGVFLRSRGRRGSAGAPGTVQVTYSTPTSAVPAAVKEAFSQLVGHWYRLAKTSEDVGGVLLTETSDGTASKSYSWALAGGLKVPTGVLQILAPFRVPAS